MAVLPHVFEERLDQTYRWLNILQGLLLSRTGELEAGSS
jgi:hypothetical protein